MSWTTQRKRRVGQWYVEAVWRESGKRTTYGLGLLDDEEAARIKTAVKDVPSPTSLVETVSETATEVASKGAVLAALRRWLFDDSGEQAIAEMSAAESTRLEAAGRYGEMALRDFYRRIWLPYRRGQAPDRPRRREPVALHPRTSRAPANPQPQPPPVGPLPFKHV